MSEETEIMATMDANEQLLVLQMNGATLGAEALRSNNAATTLAGNMAILTTVQAAAGLNDDPALFAGFNAADRTPQGGRT